ncbi:hypothetical protein CNR34_00148 [Pseudomonas phage nickie]|uniref:Uncharacterized protein n=1 Tax=Pseudomonas phage nickie TaxID=2048977 RepID=A0A2H4P7E4_9CAUD|nr:hypothetical protein FDJ16_gp017 [Pseudomonas phage nickie]ATW58081.1 hypothetical protein CNR34_00148 [Pseudomonas phage nickie]
MKVPLWFEMLCTERYKKRQKKVLDETAELIANRKGELPQAKHISRVKKRKR